MGRRLPFYLRGFFFSIYILYKIWGFIVTVPCIHKAFLSSSHVLPSLTHHTIPFLDWGRAGVCACLCSHAGSRRGPSAFLSPSLFVPWTLQMREHVLITIFLVRLTSLHKIVLVPSIFLQVIRLCSFFFLPWKLLKNAVSIPTHFLL